MLFLPVSSLKVIYFTNVVLWASNEITEFARNIARKTDDNSRSRIVRSRKVLDFDDLSNRTVRTTQDKG